MPARGPTAPTRYSPLAPFGSRGPPAPRNPRSWHLGVPFPPQGPRQHEEMGEWGRVWACAPTASTCCGPRGSPLQPSASVAPRFGGDQGSRSADRGHQGCAQRPVPLHGRGRQDARAGRCLHRGNRVGVRDLRLFPGGAPQGSRARWIESRLSSLSAPGPSWTSEGKTARGRIKLKCEFFSTEVYGPG